MEVNASAALTSLRNWMGCWERCAFLEALEKSKLSLLHK
jgi:hypothetical protein